ncbi:GNAT family N-acetyltransferase [Corynebacterium sp. SCR221107]|uniref:GNAT family N-acetyltransferase n=1 Tax=Corynebacterium sp. SCR221107 TaxID=3017361 RepID=UPI0022EC4439|nr:GNAT family N-acetyltransferase [Corynebacterium sp. SCR221107]WBT09012.1 GNAT family N-acetyltransferase [Corynebacterium sp. SCR221107]
MRLTNVAHLNLPFGRLWGYDVTVTPTERRLPISFDQRRHVGRGNRPGSWMAIAFTLPPTHREKLSDAWLKVIARHGTLRSVFVDESDSGDANKLGLREVTISPGGWVEHYIHTGEAVNDAVRRVLDHYCAPFASPSYRLCAIETVTETTVIIGVDHSHTDMWSMVVVLRDFLAALGEYVIGAPQLSEVAPFTQHTQSLREREQAPAEIHRRWAEIIDASGGGMPRFPLSLGEPGPHVERVEVRDVLGVDEAAAFSAQARADGVSSLSTVVAAMTKVTRQLANAPLRAVFPVHSRYDHQWHNSVGWFITNSVLESADPRPAACADSVKEAVRLGSWPLEDIMKPWGDMPETPGMFAISWLDLRRLPVRVDSVGLKAQYVGASIRPDGVMVWFILDETGLHLRCRYPDTPQARRNVGGWLDEVVSDIRQRARESVGGLLTVDDRQFRVQRAMRGDVADIVNMLSDDEHGARLESDAVQKGEHPAYDDAFTILARDPNQFLAVIKDDAGATVGTMQLSILPELSRGGATRLQLQAVRVATQVRGIGLASAMIEWAHEYGRARGAKMAQVSVDETHERALDFYKRLGYHPSHVGFKRAL